MTIFVNGMLHRILQQAKILPQKYAVFRRHQPFYNGLSLDSKTLSHDIQQCIKHCEEAVNGRLTTAEKVLEHPCAFKAGLNVVAVVLFVYLRCTN